MRFFSLYWGNDIFMWFPLLQIVLHHLYFVQSNSTKTNKMKIHLQTWISMYKYLLYYTIAADEVVRKFVINTLVVMNSRERWSRASRGQASVVYKSIDKQLERGKVITASSDAVHPTLLDNIKGSKEAVFSTIVRTPECSSASEVDAKVTTFTDQL